MSAEEIARVVADLRRSRVRWLLNPRGLNELTRDGKRKVDPRAHRQWQEWVLAQAAIPDAPVINATPLYEAHQENRAPIRLYEDHPCIAPPWRAATIAYARPGGNVRVVTLSATENPQQLGPQPGADGSTEDFRSFVDQLDANRDRTQPDPLWETPNEVDWSRVRWLIDGFLWVGGRYKHRPIEVQGPIHHWKFAVYDDGTPADLHWVRFVAEMGEESPPVQNTELVILGALNFLNCRNVDLVEPRRPNAERKRIARTGITVSELSVFPVGRSTRAGQHGDPAGTPLTSVRGHFASYGPEHDRGLLFGKYSGRFWRPQHARGDRAHGEVEQQNFTLEPE